MFFTSASTLIVLSGKTGSGKTLLLEHFSSLHYPVINLEQMAGHRGSAFGHTGLAPQPSPALFEQQLLTACTNYGNSKYIFTEQEAPALGKRRIPAWFYTKMQQAIIVGIIVPKIDRVKNILSMYQQNDIAEIYQSLNKLEARFSEKEYRILRSYLDNGNYAVFAEKMLDYYDASALYNQPLQQATVEIQVQHFDVVLTAQHIIKTLAEKGIFIS